MSGIQPLVSIVIPVYNGLPYLKEAIESVLHQTYSNLELIVLDDGSTDGAREFLQQYKGQFYIESHKNIGQAKTLNKGWELSKGEILGYLSADDILHPEIVEKSVQCLYDNPGIILTYPDNILIDNNSRYIRTYRSPEYNYYKMTINAVCQIGACAFFLRSAFDKLGGWNAEYRFIPDYEYQLLLASIGDFTHIPLTLAGYRIHEDSTVFGVIAYECVDEIKRLMIDYINSTNDQLLLKNCSKILANATLISVRTHWRSNRLKVGIKNFIAAIALNPLLLVSIRTYRIILNALLNRYCHRMLRMVRDWFDKKDVGFSK